MIQSDFHSMIFQGGRYTTKHGNYFQIWVCLKIVYPWTQWFCWSLSLLNGYFIGNIPNIFRQTHLLKDDPRRRPWYLGFLELTLTEARHEASTGGFHFYEKSRWIIQCLIMNVIVKLNRFQGLVNVPWLGNIGHHLIVAIIDHIPNGWVMFNGDI